MGQRVSATDFIDERMLEFLFAYQALRQPREATQAALRFLKAHPKRGITGLADVLFNQRVVVPRKQEFAIFEYGRVAA